VQERGLGRGRGYSVNLPLKPYTDDEVFIWAFDQVVAKLIDGFDPDVVVTQLGVDSLYSDPLTGLYCTDRVITHAVDAFKSLQRPWVALGGGGYNVANVARCWTLALATMLGVEIGGEPGQENDRLPDSLRARLAQQGLTEKGLHDLEQKVMGSAKQQAWSQARVKVEDIKNSIFPAQRIKAGSKR
jgi:acetoin utilization protein AcuC